MDERKPRHPDEVREAIANGGISKADLARRASLHPNSLAGIEWDAWSPRWSTLEALCKAIDAIKAERA